MAWQEWNTETLALAKKEQRMVFLSIGYNACHCKSPHDCAEADWN